MNTISKAQEHFLGLLELAEFNDLRGSAVAAALRSHIELWRAAVFVRPSSPAHTKLENPFQASTPPPPLRSSINLIVLRDLVEGQVNLDTLFVLPEPGAQPKLEELAQTWKPTELEWYPIGEARKAMGSSKFRFTEYGESDQALLRVWWS